MEEDVILTRLRQRVVCTVSPQSHRNGVIDREELRTLLESTDGGQQMGDGEHWMSDDEVDRVMRQYSGDAGVLSFDQFAKLVRCIQQRQQCTHTQCIAIDSISHTHFTHSSVCASQTADGVLLEGKLEEYREAFNAVDNGGNGTISATEIAQLFQNLGTPLSYDKLVKMMATYDVDKSGQIDFYEFLRMFRDELLDLKEILDYIKMQPTQKTEQQAKVHMMFTCLLHVSSSVVCALCWEYESSNTLYNHTLNRWIPNAALVQCLAQSTWCLVKPSLTRC